MTLDSHRDVTVAAYVRAPLLLDPVDAKVATLQSLASRDAVDGVTLHAWPWRVSESDDLFEDVATVYRRCREWASRNDVSIRQAFAVDAQRPNDAGDAETVIRTPVLCLAVHVDDHLRWVFPHDDGGTSYTAAQGVAALRTGDLPQRAGAPALPDAERPDQCRTCRGALVNVQGLLACRDCLEPAGDGEPSGPVPGTSALSVGN